jgi:hypothetical protein
MEYLHLKTGQFNFHRSFPPAGANPPASSQDSTGMRQKNRPIAAELENSKHPGFLKNPAHPAPGCCFLAWLSSSPEPHNSQFTAYSQYLTYH